MGATILQDNIAQIRSHLEELRQARQLATRDGRIDEDVRLTLQACRLRRRLIRAQTQLFGS